MYFWPEQPQNYLILLQNGDLNSWKWRGWTEMSSTIHISGFTNIAHELIFKLEWYNTSLQQHIHLIRARTATKLLNFDPKRGLAC